MELRPAYKLTDYGPIPEDWCLRPVSNMGEVITGKALAVDGPGEQRPYLRTKNVFDGRIDIDDVLSMPMTDDQFRQFMLQEGDVLLNEGQSLELVGRCAIYGGEYSEPCAIQNQLLRFRARAGVSGLFASHLFRYCQHKGVFARVALQTTSIAHLGGTRFEQLLLPWPPTETEQCAIAAALSDMDAFLDGLNRLIAKKRDLKQAAMQQLLTGQIRLPGFHGKWETKRVGEIGTTYGGLTGKTKADFGGGRARYVTFLNVLENVVIGPHQCELVRVGPGERQNPVRGGDILFNGTSETPGELAMAAVTRKDEDDLFLNSFCFGFRVHDASEHLPLYLAYYFRGSPGRHIMRALAQGATRYNLSKSQFKALALSLPQHDEQEAIATVLSDMGTEVSALEARRDKTRDLKQAMMQELLTGKTRLVQPEVAHA